MSHLVWVQRQGTIGDVVVDLHTCMRCDVPVDHMPGIVICYRSPDGMWIAEWPWAESKEELEEFVIVPERYSYLEVHPVAVAFCFVRPDLPEDEDSEPPISERLLPPELEEHREIVSHIDRYNDWKAGRGGAKPMPRWDRQERVLYYGDTECKKLRAKAHNQERVLNALQEKAWPITPISNPLGDRELLRQTIKDLNASLDPRVPLRLWQSGFRLGWKPGRGNGDFPYFPTSPPTTPRSSP
jgi:hypothetical protein